MVGDLYDICVVLDPPRRKRVDPVARADVLIAMALSRAERVNRIALAEYEIQFTIVDGQLARYAAAPVLADLS